MQPAKVTIPERAAFGLFVQARVAPPGVVSARVTELVSVVTVLPTASWIVTAGCWAKATWLALLGLGGVVKLSLTAGPAVMANDVLVADDREPSVAVSV